MPRTTLLCLLAIATNSIAHAQSRPGDQFYANSNGQYAWSVDSKKQLRTTTWFAKNPADNPSYQQMTAVIYDNKPNEVLYLDRATKRVVGRLDLQSEKFSLLPPDVQKTRQAIQKFKFPPPGELPRIEELFQPLPEGSGNRQKLQLPPPTLQFPRLEHSTWETSYMAANRTSIRSIVQFDGDKGTYRLTEKPGTGRLSNVKYEREDGNHLIRGSWNLGQSNGYFRFKVPADNLNVFWGEFGFELGKTIGAWDGARSPPGALNEPEKPVR